MYNSKRLPKAELNSYKTEFERDFFMVVNLLRDNPMSFQNYVKNFVAKRKFEGNPLAANTLIERFRTLESLQPIELNKHASAACYVNLTKNEDNAAGMSGGAVKELATMAPQLTSSNKCFDTYKRKWVGGALELLLTFLLAYYERQKPTDTHSLLTPNLKEIGCSSLESRSSGLIFQVLFI